MRIQCVPGLPSRRPGDEAKCSPTRSRRAVASILCRAKGLSSRVRLNKPLVVLKIFFFTEKLSATSTQGWAEIPGININCALQSAQSSANSA